MTTLSGFILLLFFFFFLIKARQIKTITCELMTVNVNSSLHEKYLMYKVFKIQEHIGLRRWRIINADYKKSEMQW